MWFCKSALFYAILPVTVPTKRFIYPVSSDTFIRREQVIERGKVVRFVVQLEIGLVGEATTRPVIRYDTAHGFAHIDRYNRRGKRKKEHLAITDFNQALTVAEQDIKQHWPAYRERFVRGEFP